jgi:hypothetical protein
MIFGLPVVPRASTLLLENHKFIPRVQFGRPPRYLLFLIFRIRLWQYFGDLLHFFPICNGN